MTDRTPTENATFTDLLATKAPSRTAGNQASLRTLQGNLQSALDSDDLTLVKQELLHTWAHFMAYELTLNAIDTVDFTEVTHGVKDMFAVLIPEREPTLEEIVLTTLRFVANVGADAAYGNGHALLDTIMDDNFTIPSADQLLDRAKTIYAGLDFTASPKPTYAPDSVEAFLLQLGLNPADFAPPVDTEDALAENSDFEPDERPDNDGTPPTKHITG